MTYLHRNRNRSSLLTAGILTAIVWTMTTVLTAAASADEGSGQRHLLLCCGLPGDTSHREKMTAAVRDIQLSAKQILGIRTEHQHLLVGDEQMQEDLTDVPRVTGVCTSSSVEAEIIRLSKELKADDSIFVILIGHAHLNGSASQINVRDLDFDQKDFAAWCSELPCREQIYVLTQPLSGFWIRALRGQGRFVISATEADLEFTGTEMPYALAAVLSGKAAHTSLTDIDNDQQLSLFDLYVCVNLEIEGTFTTLQRLQTEHAQLDDNGDGRGSEVQQPWLPVRTPVEEEDGDDEEEADEDEDEKIGAEAKEADIKPESKASGVISNKNLDGFRSRFVLLPVTRNDGESSPSESTGENTDNN